MFILYNCSFLLMGFFDFANATLRMTVGSSPAGKMCCGGSAPAGGGATHSSNVLHIRNKHVALSGVKRSRMGLISLKFG